jgi:hypothetical protein
MAGNWMTKILSHHEDKKIGVIVITSLIVSIIISSFFILFSSDQNIRDYNALLMSAISIGVALMICHVFRYKKYVIGLSAYLVVIGIYMSTISLSQDAELRRSVKQVARLQSKLFDSMVTAEIEKEIERRVIEVFKKQSVEMEEETGVQLTLDEQEIQDYLNQVIKEVKR